MFNAPKDQVFTLVKSLTKSEKRNFKLYVNRLQTAGESKFLQLFDVLDKMDHYDDEALLRKLPHIKKRHLANLKRHLYKQILTSLRLVHINKQTDIQIREQIDFARILYGKGMYMQSLRILDRIKKIAWDNHRDILHLEILEFQKMIETRHITRSRQAGKMEDLLKDATRRSWVTYATSLFSNLNIQMHGWYIEHGHAQGEEKIKALKSFYREQGPPENFPKDRMTFHEKINLYQANMWMHYILLDFSRALEGALQWLNQFEAEPQMKDHDPDMFMRAYYYVLVCYFMQGDHAGYMLYLNRFIGFVEQREGELNENSGMIAFVYLQLARMNEAFLRRDYQAVIRMEAEIEKSIRTYNSLLDPHRILLFYYKLAYARFGAGDYSTCLETLNQIVHNKGDFLRFDLLYAARVLHIICHYELGNYDLVDHLNRSCRRSFSQRGGMTPLQTAILDLFKVLSKNPETEHQRIFRDFYRKHGNKLQDPQERRTLSYFELGVWLKAHLQSGVNVAGLSEIG